MLKLRSYDYKCEDNFIMMLDDDSVDSNIDFDLGTITGAPGPPPNCPMCDEPTMWVDGAYMCGDCNGIDCGPETG